MADYEMRPGQMTLFENELTNKDGTPKKNPPIIKGSLRVSLTEIQSMPVVEATDKDGFVHQCVDLDVALWSKVGKSGIKYWDGSVKKKWAPEAQNASYSLPHGDDTSQYSDGSEYTQQGENTGYSTPQQQQPDEMDPLPF